VNNKKITENGLLDKLQSEAILLKPLVLYSVLPELMRGRSRADALIETGLEGSEERFRFLIEAKAQSTPMAVQTAITQLRAYVQGEEYPMVLVPYLSPERLDELEREQVSGVDLCGNGVVIVPNRLYILRTGNPNLYRESRPLGNPYAGRSSLVARMLLTQPQWPSLNEFVDAIKRAGVELSYPQASKALKALRNELIVAKIGNVIKLKEPLKLLDNLGRAWKKPPFRSRQSLRLPPQLDWANALSGNSDVRWAVTGASSVSRYAAFSQAGPLRIAVTNLATASKLLDGKPEPVPSFADIELVESDEPGFYFQNEIDENGIRWASRLQTWLELQAGDARQQDAARTIRQTILAEALP
jgi:hypothetical protein